MRRSAVLAFPDEHGEPQARLILERVVTGLDWAEATLYESDAPRRPPRTAAWLLCNPSRASHLIDDPTAGRVVHHSARADCPRSLVGNVWPLRTPYPADLWAAIARGALTEEMRHANLEALTMIAGQADIHVVAFGAAARGRGRDVSAALEAFSLGWTVPLYSLGTTDDGLPLHPLARGKFAVRNNARLKLWAPPGASERSWEEVFSDKVRTPGGWRDA